MNLDSPIGDGMIVSVAVDRFFRRVLADPALAPRFETAELHRLAAQQRAFLTAALGSTFQWSPAAPAVTAGSGTERAMAEHLAAALRDAGVPQPTIDAVTAAARQPTAPAMPGLAPEVPILPQAPAPLPQVPARQRASV